MSFRKIMGPSQWIYARFFPSVLSFLPPFALFETPRVRFKTIVFTAEKDGTMLSLTSRVRDFERMCTWRSRPNWANCARRKLRKSSRERSRFTTASSTPSRRCWRSSPLQASYCLCENRKTNVSVSPSILAYEVVVLSFIRHYPSYPRRSNIVFRSNA